MSEQGPYEAPQANLGATGVEPRVVETGRGLEWVKQAFRLFMEDAVTWVLVGFLFMLANLAVNVIPLVNFVATIFQFILLGGLIMGAHEQASGGKLAVSHIFEGFRAHTKELAILGLVVLGVVLLLVIVGVIGVAVFAVGVGDQIGLAGVLGLLLLMALTLPLVMAIWFAVPLVIFSDLGVVDVLKTSFEACLKNIGPFLVYGLVMLGLSVLAVIPFGLGLLVLTPVYVISLYVAYQEIFGVSEADVAT